jgi:hypothetical protein
MSGRLWYELFTSVLSAKGFILNPYDLCVANATINGKQCTVMWYVNNMKVSHIDPSVVTSILNLMESRFGKMAITRRRVHHFLGMDITYQNDGTASIHMPTYIQDPIDASGLMINTNVPTPCASTLLLIDPLSPALSAKHSDLFHRTVAKLIYVGTCTRTNILLALAFLCSCVSHPTEQDEHKLSHLLQYLRATKAMALTLGANSLTSFMTWVDASSTRICAATPAASFHLDTAASSASPPVKK